MPNQIQIGPQSAADGQVVNSRGDNFGNQMIQNFNGKYAELARRGQLFNFSVKTAAAFLLTNTTGNVPTIWNPAGSGKVLYLCKLKVNFVSGTTTIGSLHWCVTRNAGAAIGTAAPIVTFTSQAGEAAAIGQSGSSNMLFAPAVCTFTSAPAFYASTGMNFGAASPTAGHGNLDMDMDGEIAIYPGNALSLCYSVTTSTSLWFASIWGAELPYVG